MNELQIKDFFETQYKDYAIYDTARSIPNLIDGLKITQRKVIYTLLLKNQTQEIKVAQLASSVAYETSYHHGEVGIGSVICNLAQNFTGSNNLNWLEPIGQFGSRLSPIPAATRYIFTKLNKNFRKYFKREDDIILEHLYDDDFKIEPKFYIPIIPGIFLNPSEGIGTGFASKILSRNPSEVESYISKKLKNKKTNEKLLPYYSGFKGSVELIEKNKYKITGSFNRVNSTQIKITELPIGMYLDDIKKQLNKLIESSTIKDYDDNSTEEYFDIDVYFQRGVLSEYTDEKIFEKFKLSTTITENLTCWLPTGKLRKFDSAEEIIDYFIDWRLQQYSIRIKYLIEALDEKIKLSEEKIRFIYFYLNNVKSFKNSNKEQLMAILEKNNFKESLLDMKIWNLTGSKIQELESMIKEDLIQKEILINTKEKDLYITELKSLQ